MTYTLTAEDRERATAALLEGYEKDGYSRAVLSRIDTPRDGGDLVARAERILADAGTRNPTHEELGAALAQAEREKGDGEFVGVNGTPVMTLQIENAALVLARKEPLTGNLADDGVEYQRRIRAKFAAGK